MSRNFSVIWKSKKWNSCIRLKTETLFVIWPLSFPYPKPRLKKQPAVFASPCIIWGKECSVCVMVGKLCSCFTALKFAVPQASSFYPKNNGYFLCFVFFFQQNKFLKSLTLFRFENGRLKGRLGESLGSGEPHADEQSQQRPIGAGLQRRGGRGRAQARRRRGRWRHSTGWVRTFTRMTVWLPYN